MQNPHQIQEDLDNAEREEIKEDILYNMVTYKLTSKEAMEQYGYLSCVTKSLVAKLKRKATQLIKQELK